VTPSTRAARAPGARRGEVWLALLDTRRPVVVLTRDPLGRILHSVIAGPVTSTVRGLSTEVAVGPDDGVPRPSVVNLDNVQLVSRERLVRRVGKVRRAVMGEICVALAIATGCDEG
jgi:mRNA interferase MazF